MVVNSVNMDFYSVWAGGEEKVAVEGMYVVRYTDGLRTVDPVTFALMFREEN